MAEIDIDKLLSDDEPEEKKDLKEDKPVEQEKSPAEKADEEKEGKEVKVLKRELKKRQEEIERLKAEKEKPEEIKEEAPKKMVINEDDPAVKLWDERIEKKAQEKIKPILEANQKRAIRQFIERHPEYAAGEYKSKLKECVAAAGGKVEEGEILEAMSREWGAQNYQELERASARRDQSRSNVQKSSIKAASVGEGVKNEDDFTEEETAKAERLGMTAEEYRKARADFLANSVSQ